LQFHRAKLPDNAPPYSTLLSGHTPFDDSGFQSERLHVWYNNTSELWSDPAPHAHLESDEWFIVLRGSLVFEVDGERISIGPREVCFFPRGLYHSIVEVNPPVECFVIRAPSVKDKVYQSS
jgi:mannose-6-phosphate isomerase-like protein (cupin superfamily)